MVKFFFINYKNIIIPSNTTHKLSSDTQHYLGNIILNNNAILSISAAWDGYQGGKLLIHCDNLILHKNATITVSGLGYRGGDRYEQGESYNGIGIKSKHSNRGGGGGGYGVCTNGHHNPAANGGYGTKGWCWKTESGHNTSFGGKVYGDKELSVLYLGSGGGGAWGGKGGNGGGAIMIECEGIIRMKEGSSIIANGEIGARSPYLRQDGGNGSGGSIWIKCDKLKMDKKDVWIKAMSGNDVEYGLGRIRVDLNETNAHFYQHFVPKPYLTSRDD